MARGAIAALLLLIAIFAMPVSQAQFFSTYTSASAPPPAGRIAPETGVAIFPVTIVYNYPPLAFSSMRPTKIQVFAEPSKDAEGWCNTTIFPDVFFANCTNPSGGEISFTACLTAKLSSDAPAFALAEIGIQANADKNGFFEASSASFKITLQAGYAARIMANVEENVKSGADAEYNVTVENIGNGNTKVMFFAEDFPAGWSVEMPEPVVLGTGRSGEACAKIARIAAHSGGQGAGEIKIRIDGRSVEDPSLKCDSVNISIILISDKAAENGVVELLREKSVPDFDIIALLSAIFLAACPKIKRCSKNHE